MEKNLFKIKEFAELLGITVDTLLFYEKKGIFLPYLKKQQTGYRFYNTSQITEISLIIQLKDLGFSLDEIKLYKINELDKDKKIEILKEKIKKLETIINLHTIFNNHRPFNAYIKTIYPHYVVSKKLLVEESIFIKEKFELLVGELIVNKLRLKHPLNFYCEFFDEEFKLNNNSIEIFCEVEKSQNPIIHITEKKKYVCTVINGDYSKLAKAYDFLFSYAKTKNIKICGNPVEHYVEAYGTQKSEEYYITEIRLPIE